VKCSGTSGPRCVRIHSDNLRVSAGSSFRVGIIRFVNSNHTRVSFLSHSSISSTGNKFYAKDTGLVFYDVAPFAYHGWKEFHDGVQKEFLDSASEIKLTAGKDLKVTRRGTIAWTTVPMHLLEKSKNGKTTEMELRYTGIWEKRGTSWLLVHDNLSAPAAGS